MSFRTRSNILESTSSGTFPDFTPTQTPTEWARARIAQRTTRVNKIPMFYKEALRYIISKLGTLAYINSEAELMDIKCVHANPERTIGKLNEDNNIILPIISINQNSSNDDDKRRRGAPQIVNETFWSEEKKRAVRVISEAPRPVGIEYGINVWTKYKANLDQIVEQIRLLFNPHLVIKNTYTNVAQAYITSETDDSTLDVGDREERILRRSFAINLEAYIPNPQFLITSTGEIEEFNADTTIY